jgi:TPR repeat protein
MNAKLSILWVLAVTLACGPGAVGEALRPAEPTAADALGEGADCKSVSDSPEPFLVDWTPQDRGKLQRAMQGGVAVLSYDCKGIRVLQDCHVEGAYKFAQIAKEGPHKVLLDKNSDLSATIPLSAATLSAEVKSGMKLDLAYMMVGSRATIRAEVLRSELTGSCDGATHFVRAMWVGAFKFGTATAGSAAAGAKVLGAGAQASDASSKQVENQAGDLTACDKSASDKFTDGPPTACEAPVRLELTALAATASGTGSVVAEDEADGAPVAVEPEGPAKNPCGDGFVLDDKKLCVKKTAAAAYLCDPRKVDECVVQCDHGSGESCYNAARAQLRPGVNPDFASAMAAAARYDEKGCDKNHKESCTSFARYLNWRGGDKPRAKQVFRKACDAGEKEACYALALGYRVPTFEADPSTFTPDLLEYVLHVRKSCDLGHGPACTSLAKAYIDGVGVAKNPAAGLEALTRSCDAGDPFNCYGLAEHYRTGDAGTKDVVKAEQIHERTCKKSLHRASCMALRVLYRTGDGPVAKAFDKARAHLELACPSGGFGGPACVQLGLMYQHGEGMAADELKAVELYQKSCRPDESAPAAGCYEIGALLDGGGKTVAKDPARAAKAFMRACRSSLNPVRSCHRAAEIFKSLKDESGAADGTRTGCTTHKDKKLCDAAKRLPAPAKKPPPPPPKPPPMKKTG